MSKSKSSKPAKIAEARKEYNAAKRDYHKAGENLARQTHKKAKR